MARFGRSVGVTLVGVAALALASCAGGAGLATQPEVLVAVGSCPEVEIIPGAESVMVFAGAEEPGNVRYQAAILDTARQCRAEGTSLTFTVGVSGRIAAGPRGTGTGSAQLQVTILVDGAVVSQQGYEVSANLGPPNYGGSFDLVTEAVTIVAPAADANIRIVTGFIR